MMAGRLGKASDVEKNDRRFLTGAAVSGILPEEMVQGNASGKQREWGYAPRGWMVVQEAQGDQVRGE